MMNIIFLGYDRSQTGLITFLESRGCSVSLSAEPVSDLSVANLVISFGYRHILRQPVLNTAKRPVLNLHIAYLPWNRGAHPLFWSCLERTPNGVTIHEIDTGIDTGPICFQRRVAASPDDTFKSAYSRLTEAIEDLFIDNADALLAGDYHASPQEGSGTSHRVRDLPSGFSWDERIEEVVTRIRQDAPHLPQKVVQH